MVKLPMRSDCRWDLGFRGAAQFNKWWYRSSLIRDVDSTVLLALHRPRCFWFFIDLLKKFCFISLGIVSQVCSIQGPIRVRNFYCRQFLPKVRHVVTVFMGYPAFLYCGESCPTTIDAYHRQIKNSNFGKNR
jgi:hypothetical protein